MVQVRRALELCRRHDLPFEQAWARSIRTIRWPYETDQRREWRYALRETKAEFRAAYEGVETRASRSVLLTNFDPSLLSPEHPDTTGMMVAGSL